MSSIPTIETKIEDIKPGDTVTLRLPAEIHERLRREAFDKRTSMNALIIEALVAPAVTEDWEYGQSEVLRDGAVAYGTPVETLDEAIRRRDLARTNYPWPEELGVGRRRKAGPWEPIPEGDEAL